MNARESLNQSQTISVVIPTYNRPNSLRKCLNALTDSKVEEVVVVDDSDEEIRELNEDELACITKRCSGMRIRHLAHTHRATSPRARNVGALSSSGDIVVFIDDDMIVSSSHVFDAIREDFSLYPKVGIVGGRIVEVRQRRVDKPFYLNHSTADPLSRALGYVFLDVRHGQRFTQFCTAAMAVKREVFEEVVFDTFYRGTSYREETDFQQACKEKDWKIFYDDRFVVFHQALEKGGNQGQVLKERIYWKARNHTFYIMKHFAAIRSYWYLFAGLVIFLLYSPLNAATMLKGFRDGFHRACKMNRRTVLS